MVKKIKLANNKGVALVDDKDYEKLNKYSWHLNNGYARTAFNINGKFKQKYMHRLIMKEPKGMQIDHINNNRLCNRKFNLRIVTNQQNSINKNGTKNNSSKFKGVYWSKRDKLWISQIKIDGKTHYLGRFNNEIDAARLYNEKAKEIVSEYAYLNEV